jgi:hypothetical protein
MWIIDFQGHIEENALLHLNALQFLASVFKKDIQ